MKKKISKKQIINSVYLCIDSFNKSLNLKKKLKKKIKFEIIGNESKLDSLDLVTFFTKIEDLFYKEFKVKIKLLDEYFNFNNKKKFKTLGDLIKILENNI